VEIAKGLYTSKIQSRFTLVLISQRVQWCTEYVNTNEKQHLNEKYQMNDIKDETDILVDHPRGSAVLLPW